MPRDGGAARGVEAFLCASADGLPFLVEELLAGLVDAGVLVEQEGHWSVSGPLNWQVPPTFADAVGRRLAALPAPARDVAHATAEVLGRRFDWSLLLAVAGLDEADVTTALRQAVGVQLLTAEDGGFRFRHALTRDAVLGDLYRRSGRASRVGRWPYRSTTPSPPPGASQPSTRSPWPPRSTRSTPRSRWDRGG